MQRGAIAGCSVKGGVYDEDCVPSRDCMKIVYIMNTQCPKGTSENGTVFEDNLFDLMIVTITITLERVALESHGLLNVKCMIIVLYS